MSHVFLLRQLYSGAWTLVEEVPDDEEAMVANLRGVWELHGDPVRLVRAESREAVEALVKAHADAVFALEARDVTPADEWEGA